MHGQGALRSPSRSPSQDNRSNLDRPWVPMTEQVGVQRTGVPRGVLGTSSASLTAISPPGDGSDLLFDELLRAGDQGGAARARSQWMTPGRESNRLSDAGKSVENVHAGSYKCAMRPRSRARARRKRRIDRTETL